MGNFESTPAQHGGKAKSTISGDDRLFIQNFIGFCLSTKRVLLLVKCPVKLTLETLLIFQFAYKQTKMIH